MVEPLEETRSELVFATEPVLSSLELSIPDSVRKSTLVELDEVEVTNVHPSDLKYRPTFFQNADTKRHPSTMQRTFVPPQFG